MTLDELVKDVVSHLSTKKQTLAVAESCTGGMLSAKITDLAGVSNVYLGGVVSYANSAKEGLIDVPHELLLNHGAVSREVASCMATGVRLKLSSSWSVAITGIAGPTGGTPDKPVGTVWFSIAGPNLVEPVTDVQLFKGDRSQIRLASVEHALQMLKSELLK